MSLSSAASTSIDQKSAIRDPTPSEDDGPLVPPEFTKPS
jgi:hypothetical protein